MVLRRMDACEIGRVAEIDRSEQVRVGYRMRDGALAAETVDWSIPPWSVEGGEHSIEAKVRSWGAELERGGVLLGVFDGGRLTGVAILRYRLTEDLAQLAVLHVSRAYRRQGVGGCLLAEVERLAREEGARGLYVSSAPTESAVGFYLGHGFLPTDTPHPDLLALEPDDIHMTKPL